MSHTIKILHNNIDIAHTSSYYLYTNTLNFDRANVEQIEDDGYVTREGNMYYIIKNCVVSLFKPSYDTESVGVISKSGKPIGYLKQSNFESYFKPVSDIIMLCQFPDNTDETLYNIKTDENGIKYQEILFDVELSGGSGKIKTTEINQYQILNGEHYSVGFDNGIFIKYIKEKKGRSTHRTYEVCLINYGKISAANDSYYILAIHHADNLSTTCRIRLMYDKNIRVLSLMHKSNVYGKNSNIKLHFDFNGGKEEIPFDGCSDIIEISNKKTDWISVEIIDSSIVITCDSNKGNYRNSELLFSVSEDEFKISVEQDKYDKYELLVDKDTVIFSNMSDVCYLKVNSLYGSRGINVVCDADWVRTNVEKLSEMKYHTRYDIKLEADKNLTYQDRDCNIIITHTDNPQIKKIINIKQKIEINPDDKFIDITDNIIFQSDGGEVLYDVVLFPFTDCTFSIVRNPAWVECSIQDNKLLIKCSRNLFNDRASNIVLINNDFPFSPLIKRIIQKGK